jgi:putative flippase GtrA
VSVLTTALGRDEASGERTSPPRLPGTGSVEIVIPVYNEERSLPGCVRTLHRYLTDHFPVPWRITIANNASTDATAEVARELATELPRVGVLDLDRKGRGLALREAWGRSDAAVVAYMDVDLSTGLDALLPLVAPLLNGHSDVAIGSRLAPGARVVRGAKREVISRCYNALIRLSHGARFSDAQCGFKAVRTDVLRPLLPHLRDDSWFFDTELLLLAEHNGLRIHEVPVDWLEDVDTRVDVTRTALDDLRGLYRVAKAKVDGSARVPGLPRRPELAPTHPDAVLGVAARSVEPSRGWQLLCFVLIGLASTAVTAGLYAPLRGALPPLAANLLALVATTLLNTEANRRLTFLGSATSTRRAHAQGLVVFALYYAFTSGALLLLDRLVPNAGRLIEVVVLVAACGLGTVGRFALLRGWVFGRGAEVSGSR